MQNPSDMIVLAHAGFLGLMLTITTPTLKPAAAQPAGCDFSPATDPITAYLQVRPGIPGAGLRVVQHGFLLHEQYWRTYDAGTSLRIASATKLLSAIAILSLVDDGLIDLDAPVSTYLPAEFPVGTPKGSITVRQMFSHTSGLATSSPWISNDSITLAQAVTRIGLTTPLIATPGTEFNYGGVSMHVAGRVAEVVSGKSWIALFQERVTAPLEMVSTDFAAFGPTLNPRIAGGARCSLEDYSHLLEMLVQRGTYRGVRVLSEAAVDTLLADQTNGAAAGVVPDGVDEYLGYGIGIWIELRDVTSGAPLEFSCPGAFGATPWINPGLGLVGVFMIDDTNQSVDALTDALRPFAREYAQPHAGDMNFDGVVSTGDIAGFVLALTDVEGYAIAQPWCNINAADVNGDGAISVGDIEGFVGLLTE